MENVWLNHNYSDRKSMEKENTSTKCMTSMPKVVWVSLALFPSPFFLGQKITKIFSPLWPPSGDGRIFLLGSPASAWRRQNTCFLGGMNIPYCIWHTGDGCEILHQLIDGFPIIIPWFTEFHRHLLSFPTTGFCNHPQYGDGLEWFKPYHPTVFLGSRSIDPIKWTNRKNRFDGLSSGYLT